MGARLGPPPKPTSDAVTRSMKGNKGGNTKPELQLRRLLREAGYPGYRLHWKSAPGRPDIAYPGRRVAVFVNGCFWHRCPHCQPVAPRSNPEFWERKFELNQERDERKRRELEEAGWNVLVVWECELKRAPDKAVQQIVEVLRCRD